MSDQTSVNSRISFVYSLLCSLGGATVFYTILPLPHHWPLNFDRMARWAPLIGIILGGALALVGMGLRGLGMPPLPLAVGMVLLGLWWTGGLHFDGAMDTADGLAVLEPERRLGVMRDSATGAFGVMGAIALFALKVSALASLNHGLWLLPVVMGWGRWGQGVAIARYPYLHATGKGAIHKETLKVPQDLLFGLIFLLALMALQISLDKEKYLLILIAHCCAALLALGIGAWLARQLGGHTGDSYGAIVEWTEAIALFAFTLTGP
ncbi:adenosylcobinamide-GDP ribazoletransferase [Spirulina sp. CCNP1310]|uniref:adenosylcobinamide-GDP ribazoletransferase n=1 Tax=Spirulina sp. CCNP1310 TaxID=3110249 RepID=UPI002B205664|nr:adenosylcobinamide-GDP ribazoletransferase [Spirulina sp. CCNP1310]MEA5421037.1 adenosylcobinamide-GDP ribazoletransferase [Spirulina sp. CCNP1310]